jgi:hypothetical protein
LFNLFEIGPSCLNLCLPEFKNIFPSLRSFKSLEIIRRRTGQLSKDLTDDAIFKEIGPTVFANAADEDGGVVKRKKKTAKKGRYFKSAHRR